MFDLSSLAPRIGDVFVSYPSLGTFFRSSTFAPLSQVAPEQQQRASHMKGDYENQYNKFFGIVSKIQDDKMEQRIRRSLLRKKSNDCSVEFGGDSVISWEDEEAKKLLGKRVFDILWKFCGKYFIVCEYRMFYEDGAVHVLETKEHFE